MRRLLAALVLSLSCSAVAGDLTLVSEATAGGKTRTVTISARGTKAYFEVKDADGTSHVMLRDAEAKKMFIVDPAKKTVLVVTEEDSKAAEARQEEFKAQLQAQLAKMPKEQRERVEAGMLKTMAPPAAKVESPSTYEKKKGPARKLNGFTCEDYVIKRDGKDRGEACFTPWKSTGMSAEEIQKIIADAMPKQSLGGHGAPQIDAELQAPGFPVWRKFVDEQGQVTAESTVKSISKTALPAEKFEVPKDYVEKSIGDAMKRAK